MRRDITFLALGGGSLLLSFFAPAALPVNPAWLAILLVGEERVTLLHFTDTLTIALRCDGAARLFAALSATLWPFTATKTSPLYLSLSLNLSLIHI